MTIKIFVFNYLTKTVEIDSTIEVNGGYETAEANHQAYREMFPDCQVNFKMDEDNFIFAPPINMQKDEQAYEEDRMTWNEYVTKWHGGVGLDSDDDMPDYEVERQIDELMEADWDMRDSVCH